MTQSQGHSWCRCDELRLIVPAHPRYVRLARLTAVSVAAEHGFGYEELEDVRIAVGEASSILLDAGLPGTLTLVFAAAPRELWVRVTGRFVDGPPPPITDRRLSECVLDAVVDHHEYRPAEHVIRFHKSGARLRHGV